MTRKGSNEMRHDKEQHKSRQEGRRRRSGEIGDVGRRERRGRVEGRVRRAVEAECG